MELRIMGKTPPRYGHWVIQDTVMGLTVLFGEYSTYKTFLAASMVVSVASGKPWFGKQVKHGPVLYLMGEGADEADARFIEAAREIGVTPDDNYRLAISPQFDLNKPHALEPLYEGWENTGFGAPPVLVVVDTVSRYLDGDENKQECMREFVNALDAMKTHWGCAVVALHHKSKPQATGLNGTVRGSTVLPGAADVMLELSKKEDSNVLTIKASKLKDLDTRSFHPSVLEGMPVHAKHDTGLPILDEFGRPRTTVVLKEPKAVQNAIARAQEVFYLLYATRPTHKAVGIKEWEEGCGLSPALFIRALMGLLADGSIKKAQEYAIGHYTLGDNDVKVVEPGICYQSDDEYNDIQAKLDAEEVRREQEEEERRQNLTWEDVRPDPEEEAKEVLEELD